jgi:hypothetical protein
LFVELLFGDRWRRVVVSPFSFGGLRGNEALVALRPGFSGLAWVSAFSSRLGQDRVASLGAPLLDCGAGDRPTCGAVLPGFVEQLGSA